MNDVRTAYEVQWQVAQRIKWDPYKAAINSSPLVLAPMFAPIVLVDDEHPGMHESILGTRYDASADGTQAVKSLEKAQQLLADAFVMCLELALWKHVSIHASSGRGANFAWMNATMARSNASFASGAVSVVSHMKHSDKVTGRYRYVLPDGIFYSNPGAVATVMLRTAGAPNGFDTRIMDGASATERLLQVRCKSMIQIDKANVFYEPDAIPAVQ